MKKLSKIKQKMSNLKQKFQDKSFEEKSDIDPEVKRAIETGLIYEEVLGDYLHKPALRYFSKLGEKGIPASVIGQLKRVVRQADELGMDMDTYVRAQFYWFHTWFKRAPKISEMMTDKGKFPATKRAKEYLKVSEDKKRMIFSRVLPSWETSSKKLDQINYERLKQLTESWGKTEREIMATFAQTGVFDQKWLNKHPLYLELKRAGKLQ